MDDNKNLENAETETENEKEVIPEWAQKMKSELTQAMENLKESLSPNQETPTDAPTEIVLPKVPEQETPTPEEIETEEQEQETPKKKQSFLGWLF